MNHSHTVFIAGLLFALSSTTFAAGDAEHGQQLYESRCVACHSVDQNRVGPAHQGVFGRRAGLAPGYEYSKALKTTKIVWSEKTLDAWLSNPERTIPGQKMGFSVTDATDRTDLIAYLKKISGK